MAAEEARAIDDTRPKSIEVVISKEAGGLEQFAAAELHRYLQRLFGASVRVVPSPNGTADSVFVLGTSDHLPGPRLGETPLPQLSDQGFLLRKTTCQEQAVDGNCRRQSGGHAVGRV